MEVASLSIRLFRFDNMKVSVWKYMRKISGLKVQTRYALAGKLNEAKSLHAINFLETRLNTTQSQPVYGKMSISMLEVSEFIQNRHIHNVLDSTRSLSFDFYAK